MVQFRYKLSERSLPGEGQREREVALPDISHMNQPTTMAGGSSAMVATPTEEFKTTNCLTINLSERDSLPHERNLSERSCVLLAESPSLEQSGRVEMRLTMKERITVSKAMAAQYRRASKKRRGEILDQFVAATDYNRVYAAQVPRGHGRRVEVAPGVVVEGSARTESKSRPRAPTYGPEELKALKKVWRTMDFICGKRLAPLLAEVLPCLVRHGELGLSQAVGEKLIGMSAATIDRLLEAERRKAALKGRG